MPTIKISTDNLALNVQENYPLINLDAEHTTSLVFGCRDASCGACCVQVLEGENNLTPKGEAEINFLNEMAANENERLACQCKVKGDITIDVAEW
ncbi:MAG: 2Fe-2S iron-sulfur cluster-binding protein [Oligoflexales bacterium]